MGDSAMDKSSWPEGPWQDEPDHKDWEHVGYCCSMNRNFVGVWCGYVDVPAGSKLYEVDYMSNNRYMMGIEVHGGLTYSDKIEDCWRVGFDCGHYGDFTPGQFSRLPFLKVETSRYRDIKCVTANVNSLAEQIRAIDNE